MGKRLGFTMVIVALVVVIIGAIFFVLQWQKISSIETFEECAAAGYPVLKSYPAQCRTPDGRIFGQRIPQTERQVAFTELKKGFFSEIMQKQQRVIRTTEEWSDLWTELFPTEMITPLPLGDTMVIAVFMGQRGGGYATEITKIIEDGNLHVYVKEISPGKGCVVIQAITQPYHVVQLQKSDKDVEFIFEEERRDC